MAKIKIISQGKTKEPWLESALDEYVKRLKLWATCEFAWAKNEEQLMSFVEKESDVIGLDSRGEQMTSKNFSVFLEKKLIEGGSKMAFVIGGPDGLPAAFKAKVPLLSFSKMTFTHQMVRLILVEQVYRAFTILNGLPYHK